MAAYILTRHPEQERRNDNGALQLCLHSGLPANGGGADKEERNKTGRCCCGGAPVTARSRMQLAQLTLSSLSRGARSPWGLPPTAKKRDCDYFEYLGLS